MDDKGKQKYRRFLSPLASSPSGANTNRSVTPIPSRSPSPTGHTPPAASTIPTGTGSPPAASSSPSQLVYKKSKQERALEAASCFQALLGIVEKTLDGVPSWGVKAAVGVAGEILKATRLKVENDETIKDIQREAANIQTVASTSNGMEDLFPTPPELQERLDKFKIEMAAHLRELDQYQVAQSLPQAPGLRARVKTWLVAGEEILAANAISKALPDINKKIAASIQNFMLAGQIRSEAILYSVNGKVDSINDKVNAIYEAQQSHMTGITTGASYAKNHDADILAQLYPVKTALHSAKGAARTCHKGTREAVLREVKDWFQDPESPPVLWLSGIAGTGKTTVAQSICEMLDQHLGASFLFSRDFAERRQPSNILSTIAYQLAYNCPALRPAICKMLSKDPDFVSKSTRVQAQELLFRALGSELTWTSDFPVTLILFDALDECEKDNGQEGGDVVPLILRFLRNYPSRFKVVITSRPEASIRGMLEGEKDQTNVFKLHEVDRNMIQSDIEIYLDYELAQIATKRGLRDDAWPRDLRTKQVKQLAELADRLFIFASTMVKALSKSSFPSDAIQSFLENVSRSSDKSLHGPLDAMYLQVVKGVIPVDAYEQDVENLLEGFQCIVGAILTLEQPLTFSSLRQLLKVRDSQLHAVIGALYAVLDVDDSFERPIQVFHLSFPDFLTDDKRCIDGRFHIVRKSNHDKLSIGCLRIMNEQLKKDICDIRDPSLLNVEVEGLVERCERCTSAELRYACLYWWAHLEHVESVTEELVKELETFTSGKLLQWLELLSVMGNLRSALIGLQKAIRWCRRMIAPSGEQGNRQGYRARVLNYVSTKYPRIGEWRKSIKKMEEEEQLWPSQELSRAATLLYDLNRTTQAFFLPISESALQVYESALMLMPRCFLLSQSGELHSGRITMTTERREQWSQDLRVMEGHKDKIRQVVVSPNGSLLASCSDDKTIRLWDLASGVSLVHVHSDSDHLAFSTDGSRLLSFPKASYAIQTWDVVSGELLSTFNLRLNEIQLSVSDTSSRWAISPSGDFVAIGVENGDLCMLGVDKASTRLQGHKTRLRSVTFSQNGSLIASGSDDKNVRLWDVRSLSCIATFHMRSGFRVSKVGVSSDGFQVVALARNFDKCISKVWVWNVETQKRVSSWKIPDSYYPDSMSVSENSLVCSFKSSNILQTHDLTTGQLLSMYEGHTGQVSTTTFVPDGSYVISGSKDCTIRVWDAQINANPTPSSQEHNRQIYRMVLSDDGTKLITVSDDKTCRWDTRLGKATSEIEKTAHIVGFLAGGTPVGVNWGWTIDVWNAETGEDITTLRGHSHDVNDAAFSPDFTRLASGSGDGTVRIWNTATWECTATLTGHTDMVRSVCFSPDGSRIVSGSGDRTVRVWDAGTGDALAMLEGHTNWVRSVCFSPDGSRVVSGSFDRTVRVWDAGTGDALAVLEGHTYWVYSVCLSSDGLSIVSRDFRGNEREWKAGVDFHLPTSSSPLPPFVQFDNLGWLFLTTPSTRRRLCWLPLERRGRAWFSGSTIVVLSNVTANVIILTISDTIPSLG